MFKELLQKGILGETFSEREAKQLMDQIMNGNATESQIASLLTILRFRGETIDEMTGFVASMREHVLKVDGIEDKVVDTCGTGGDGANTFNISTASAVVMASLGVKVAKHGNRAFSSKSGSADVLEHLGIQVQATPNEAKAALSEYNMCFLFAPLYHVAMKHAVIPRKEIGFRTIFNVLGPLSNPAGSKHQLVGVFSKKLARKMAETLKRLGTERALFVTGHDGLDEITITTSTNIIELNHGVITEYTIHPSDFGIQESSHNKLQVENVLQSANKIRDLFQGTADPAVKNIVAMNTGAGLYVSGKTRTLEDGVQAALNALETGLVQEHYIKMCGGKVSENYA
jgi:anthranilate phosphoribosyltransferase